MRPSTMRKLVNEGADLLDLGGESTQPGAQPVSLDEELRRVLPVVRQLVRRGDPASFHRYVQGRSRAAGTEAGGLDHQ